MKTRLKKLSLSALLAAALAACGGLPDEAEHVLDDAEPDAALSLTQGADNVQQSDAWAALETCVPAPEEETHMELGDVRIADVALTEEDGQAQVEVTLANVAGVMALGYPGAVVEVVGGDATVGASPFEPANSASFPFYGIEACSTAVAPIAIVWGDEPEAKLIVRAVSGFQQPDGQTEWESLVVTVARD